MIWVALLVRWGLNILALIVVEWLFSGVDDRRLGAAAPRRGDPHDRQHDHQADPRDPHAPAHHPHVRPGVLRDQRAHARSRRVDRAGLLDRRLLDLRRARRSSSGSSTCPSAGSSTGSGAARVTAYELSLSAREDPHPRALRPRVRDGRQARNLGGAPLTWYAFLLFVHVSMAVIWIGGGLMMQLFGSSCAASVSRRAGSHGAVGEDIEWIANRVFIPASLAGLPHRHPARRSSRTSTASATTGSSSRSSLYATTFLAGLLVPRPGVRQDRQAQRRTVARGGPEDAAADHDVAARPRAALPHRLRHDSQARLRRRRLDRLGASRCGGRRRAHSSGATASRSRRAAAACSASAA